MIGIALTDNVNARRAADRVNTEAFCIKRDDKGMG